MEKLPGDILHEIAELTARVQKLETERWSGTPRLGPQPLTPEQEADRALEMSERIAAVMKTATVKADVPPVDRSNLCTTDGRSPAEARASQTNDTGQYASYIVLCDTERAKGFVRPYRDRYKHTTCGGVTTMGRALSETYARDPQFYDATFCCSCNRHLPVSEFIWTADGQTVGS
jgi:hypothetical protein